MFKLSNQALGAIMLALQTSLLEPSVIAKKLKGFRLKLAGVEIFADNFTTDYLPKSAEVDFSGLSIEETEEEPTGEEV